MTKSDFGPPYGPHEGPDRDNPPAPGMPVAIALVALVGFAATILWIYRHEILEMLARILNVGPR